MPKFVEVHIKSEKELLAEIIIKLIKLEESNEKLGNKIEKLTQEVKKLCPKRS